MRIRTGHGPNDWTENVPADPGMRQIKGAFVTGDPGPYEKHRQQVAADKAKKK